MEKNSFLKTLTENNIEIKNNVCLKELTTFKIGGEAEMFITVKDEGQAVFVKKTADKYNVPLFVLGKGSNLLVSDNGLKGATLSLELNHVIFNGNIVTCGAGLTLQKLCVLAMEKGLSGLEFAFGIPGSVGGAIYMNAGAYGGEMADCVVSAKYIDDAGNIKTVSREDMALGYRTSIFKNSVYIITEATFLLKEGKREEILGKMNGFMGRRKEKQPLEFASAGSTFKRPEGYFAGALIEKNGLKGKRVGDAMVSEKHAGFVVNCGSATSKDVKELIEIIRKTVYENDGVNLEPEVIFVGE